jgi:putative ATP-binding cassette transporter
MNLISFLYHKSWKLMLLAVLTGIISGVAGGGLIAIISKGVTAVQSTRLLALSFFGLCLFYLLMRYYSQVVMLYLVQGVTFRLRLELSRKLLATPYKRLQELGKARLLVILTQDVERFIAAFQVLPTAIGTGVVILASLAYMGYLSWQVLIVFTVTLLVSLTLYRLAQRAPTRRMRELRERTDSIYNNFQGLIEGSKELKLNAERGRRFVDEVITPNIEDYRRTYILGFTGYAWALNTALILIYLFIGILMFVAPAWIALSTQTITAITLILLYINGPLNALMSALPTLSQAGISLGKIQQLDSVLSTECAVPPDPAIAFPASGAMRLQLHGISHTYQGPQSMEFMLGPVDLDIHAGEVLFVVGGNGSGKTTLAMLLLGLYEPQGGQILLNGVAVTDGNRDSYRQLFSAVFSDFHLFQHILGADREQISEQANRYLRQFQLDHKASVVDGRISSIELSAGQRRRLALVSAYLEDRPVYLFDEWAADQDPAFKRIFYTEILPDLKARGKTVIVISHDDAYFAYADRTVRLRDGALQSAQAGAPELCIA